MERDAVELASGRTKREMIDWLRIAQPQPDAYDCAVALTFCGNLPLVEAPNKIFGTVAVTSCSRSLSPELTNAALDHPNIKEAERLVNLWPEGAASFKHLMREFHPLEMKGSHGRGSTCGSDESLPGKMYATVHSAPGLAEAFLHECGHNKLRYLGIQLEHADRIVGNPPDELFVSPLRKDKPRPMTAVLHACLSYSYVLELDLAMWAAEGDRENLDAIKLNHKRMAEGREVMKNFKPADEDGEDFITGYFTWLDSLLARSEAVINAANS